MGNVILKSVEANLIEVIAEKQQNTKIKLDRADFNCYNKAG